MWAAVHVSRCIAFTGGLDPKAEFNRLLRRRPYGTFLEVSLKTAPRIFAWLNLSVDGDISVVVARCCPLESASYLDPLSAFHLTLNSYYPGPCTPI